MNRRTAICLVIGVAAGVAASPAIAQEQTKQSSPMQELATESNIFWARVATFFGLDPQVIQGIVPEFRQEGVNTRDAVLLSIFAHKRTLRLLRGEKITKDELGARFRDEVHELLAIRRVRTNWKTLLSDQLGVDLNEMVKQAANSVREAMRAPADGSTSVRLVPATTPKEVPEDFSQPLRQRLRVGPEALKQAWGALDPIAQRSPRAAVIILVLAKEKTDRLLEYRTVAPKAGEHDKLFLDALAQFIAQVEARPRVGWGTLASQAGVTAEDLHREAYSIIIAAAQRQQQREGASGSKAKLLVPSELNEW